MPVRIGGVDPELTKLTTFDSVMDYMNSKGQIDRIDPAHYDTEDLKKWLLHYHNKYRTHHNAGNMATNGELNKAAQKWANEMAHRKQCLVHEQPSKFGENLSYFAATHFPSPNTCAAAIIQGFYTEGVGYDYSRFDASSWTKTGHFTQLLWKASVNLGVGVANVKRGSMHHIYVCLKYDPPGNMQTSDAYLNNIEEPKGKSCCIIS
ncbi:hypothetical protein CRE_03257 [Caenorhabditis remanei]|uniref:SCP domain-containing protein n=1 Tax=Caenorhabditis remanei TaxID=31234 RepID=E3MMM1_CAERE|nr:hypothetical protein CRE_03257 [Caenorhabditis remanei]